MYVICSVKLKRIRFTGHCVLKQSVNLFDSVVCFSLMYFFLLYIIGIVDCIVLDLVLVVAFQFKVHCFTCAWFIYRLLYLLPAQHSLLVTLKRLNHWRVELISSLSWAFHGNVYGFYGLNLNQRRFNMIRLNYINEEEKNVYTFMSM